jgi:hypothetical protein
MRYTIILAVLVTGLTACSSNPKSTEPTSKVVAAPPTTRTELTPPGPAATINAPDAATVAALNKYLKSLELGHQQFECRPDSISMVTGRNGTRIFVVPQDLQYADGSTPEGQITVQLLELNNTEHFLRNNAQTVSGGKLLESGGSYDISMSCAGKGLQLKPGKKLSLQFPNIGDKAMEVFYGRRDKKGDMDWMPTSKSVSRKTAEDSTYMRVAVNKYRDSILAEMEVRPGHKPTMVDHDKFRGFDKVGLKLVDGHFYYVGRKVSNREYVLKKTSALDAMAVDAYASIEINQLGWLNIDKFSDWKPVEMLAQLSPNNKLATVQTFVAYIEAKSIVAKRLQFNEGAQSLNVVPGKPVKIVALSWKDGTPYASVQKMVAQTGQKIQLDLKPVTKAELDKMIAM